MANVDLLVYEARRSVLGVNFTDNKTAGVITNTYFFPNDGNTKLILQSTTGGDVTFETPNTEDGMAIADKVVTLAATKIYVIGPFPPNTYNQGGKVKVTIAAATDILAFRG